MPYSKLDLAIIFKSCKDIVDVMEACKAFRYLKQNNVRVPGYVEQLACLRVRQLS